MNKKSICVSTIDPNAHLVAEKYNLNLEIAEFCTAWNLEEHFPETDAQVREKRKGLAALVLHGPFNELFPCAIDPRAKELARLRYRQALEMASRYGADRVVLHGGFVPRVYHDVWFVEQSVSFWKEFLPEVPETVTICLENVLENRPELLLDIVRQVEDPRLGLCLDVGHANVYSTISVMQWLERCAPYLRHFHIHNNTEEADTHQGLPEGTIPMKELLERMEALCPRATCTLELPESEPSVVWLLENRILEE